jgi:pimeloyl-ACP methyl ester carboxylesterase
VIGVGHSMGGHAMVQAAAAQPARFTRLLLVDPVIMDPALYAQAEASGVFALQPSEHPTAKRNNQWQSWREMFERLKGRASFAVWRDDVLEDYCRYGLLPNPDGPDWMLACPPLVEAAIYTGSIGRDIHDLFQRIQIPVVVLRAQRRERTAAMDFLASPTWPALAQQFPHGRDVYLPHLTHFIPMQEPALVARFIEDQDATVVAAS